MNKFRKEKKVGPKKVSKFRKGVLSLLNGTFLVKDRVLQHMPFVLFLVLMAVIYITYGYHAENTVKKMYRLEAEVKDMKSQDLTLKSDLEIIKQQSNIAESIQEMGLKESVTQPFKIIKD